MESNEARIRDFVLKTFPLARKNGIKEGEKWLETGMMDSLGILDLVQFLEKEFSIHVSDDELLPENFESLSAVVSFVNARQGGAAKA
jgi:acyl carrier protein